MSEQPKSPGRGTLAVHAGVEPDPTTGAIMTPVYLTSTYVQDEVGNHKGFEYSRTHNPTRSALEAAFAALEHGAHGLAFASGLAAMDTVLKTLKPGDEVISTNDLYGGSYRLFTTVFANYGITFHFVDLGDLDALRGALNEDTRLVWIETPTNPMMQITDIAAVAEVVKDTDARVVVDNTFASPMLQNPLDLGADMVMHSVTKYLGGHSDVVMGCLMTSDDAWEEELRTLQNSCGSVPGPMDCFLVLRGLKTLHLRMQRHCENGAEVARHLQNHPAVAKVHWPGFEDHPGHDVAARQMHDYGGMVAFTLANNDLETAKHVVASTKVFTLAESLGGVESLIGHPATMTHASIPKEVREKTGVTDGLIRLSVGIEDVADLIADLDQALNQVQQAHG
ncbi:cystathionine gamma-synthase [Flavobacteriales bacterium]|nr:cystathionine gamma-synthase [Flavobacteriales bacterium]